MPIIHKSSINSDVAFLIWEISESEPELLDNLDLNSEELDDLESISVDEKRLEWLGARNALKVLVRDIGQFYIYKDQYGKPHLKDSSIGISVSHTKNYGAAAINLAGEVGIDIERERQQIHRIARRFLHPKEKDWINESTAALTKVWAAKEALYKLHGRTQLTFSEQLLISDFHTTDFTGRIIENEQEQVYKLTYQLLNHLHICCAH